MASSSFADDLVKEYLLFRGLTTSLKSFDAELKSEKDKGFRIDKIISQLNELVSNHELNALQEYWAHLDSRLFSRLPHRFSATVRKLEVSLFRLYLVNVCVNERADRMTEFFQKMTPELQNQAEWKEWFALPYVKKPEENPTFATYFTRHWQDMFWLSLFNFLSVLFECLPTPRLLGTEAEQKKIKELIEENEKLREQLALAREGKRTHVSGDTRSEDSSVPELMDDFFCIAKESSPMFAADQKGRIKSFIKNITLPSSPMLGKKPSPSSVPSMQPGASGPSNIPKKSSQTSLVTIGDEKQSSVVSGKGKGKESVLQSSQPAKPKSKSNVPVPSGPTSVFVKTTTAVSAEQNVQRPTSAEKDKNKQRDSKQQRIQREQQEREKQRKELLGDADYRNDSQAKEDRLGQTPSANNSNNIVNDHDRLPKEPSNIARGEVKKSSKKVAQSERAAPSPFLLLSQDEYKEHQSAITHCRFSPTGSLVASCDYDGIVKIWSISPSPNTVVVVMTKSPILCLEWAGKTDKYLLLGSRMGSVRMFDTVEKKNIYEVATEPGYPRVLSLSANPTGASFVCSCATRVNPEQPLDQCKGKLMVWNLKSMKTERQLPLDSDVTCINCTAFNHNGNLLVAGSANGMVKLYDMQRNESIACWKAHTGQVHSIEFSQDENSCYTMGGDGKFIQWSLLKKSGRCLADIPIHDGATGPFTSVNVGGQEHVVTPRGRLFAYDSEGKHVLTCGPTGGQIYRIFSDGGASRLLELGGHTSAVSTVDWTAAVDCGTCITGSIDGRIRISVLLSH